MSFFDKFKKKFERVSRDERKPKHVVKDDTGGLTAAEIAAAKSLESGRREIPKRGADKAGSSSAGKAVREKTKREDTRQAPRILLHPIVTEKATSLVARRKYVFAVHPHANKIEVRKAIRAVYGVVPEAVNLLTVGSRSVRFGRVTGRTKQWKKAIITLPAGEQINVYE